MPDINLEQAKSPTILTIFGGTGDLSQKKLLPALFDLFRQGLLPNRFQIVGFAKSEHTNDEYRQFVKTALEKKMAGNEAMTGSFLELITYRQGDFTEPESYKNLADHLIELEGGFGQCSNKLFYLAVSPGFYDTVLTQLADSGLTIPCSNDTGWTRVLVEKPFGKDIETAQMLDHKLSLLFKEEQIFRIDHYLGKETLQDILMFRFSNLIFEPLWNNKYIERVEITLHEDNDVSDRGAFYDGLGALRDVGQNHILQMLAAVAMDNPMELDPYKIRCGRAKVLEMLRPVTKETIVDNVIRAQYAGYRNEKDVSPDSSTETFFQIRAFIDSERWNGVPFYLESGKALGERLAEIRIYFKKTDSCLCPPDAEHHHANILTFRIQPDEGISVVFWAKQSGFTSALEPKELSFMYNSKIKRDDTRIPDAYERILFDGITGDQTLFTNTEEVTAAWNFITPIMEHWDTLSLLTYEKGSNGPEKTLSKE